MPQDITELRVGTNGTIYAAPTTAAIPANIDAAFSADWVDLGVTSDEGATLVNSRTLERINIWQSFYAARMIVTEQDLTMAFALAQWNADTVVFAFGGGEVVTDGADQYTFNPPDPQDLDERRLALEVVDGDFTYRFILRRGIVTEDLTVPFRRTEASLLPITFGILGETGVKPFLIQSNDPAMAPTGS